ncbi:MAG: hypothetical protein HY869_06915 [Chloroflexi bacterium]|nr:hypothetical protein [Chloroflexota bacterium]
MNTVISGRQWKRKLTEVEGGRQNFGNIFLNKKYTKVTKGKGRAKSSRIRVGSMICRRRIDAGFVVIASDGKYWLYLITPSVSRDKTFCDKL